jgi:hypothetical protein
MAVATFDTLKYAKALRAAGVTEQEADAHVDALKELMQSQLGQLATKDDLKEHSIIFKRDLALEIGALKHELAEQKQEFKHDIAEFRKELKHELAEQKQELKHDIAQLETRLVGKMDVLEQRLRTEQYLIRWMLGLSISIGLAVAVRLFFFRVGP